MPFWRHEWRMRMRDIVALAELGGLCGSLLLVWLLLADHQMQLALPASVATWVTLLFATVLYAGRSFDAEWSADGSRALEGWKQMPGQLPKLMCTKWLMNVLLLCGVGSVVWCALALIGNVPGPLGTWHSAVALVSGIAGLSAFATLFAGLLCMENRPSALLPLVCYPLALPLILAVSQCLLADIGVTGTADVWMRIAMGTGLLYSAGSLILFPYVIGIRHDTAAA